MDKAEKLFEKLSVHPMVGAVKAVAAMAKPMASIVKSKAIIHGGKALLKAEKHKKLIGVGAAGFAIGKTASVIEKLDKSLGNEA
jgi:hypothetical protein